MLRIHVMHLLQYLNQIKLLEKLIQRVILNYRLAYPKFDCKNTNTDVNIITEEDRIRPNKSEVKGFLVTILFT